MRSLGSWAVAVILGAAAFVPVAVRAAVQEETFDACDVFTSDDAEKALGVAAAAEPVNPKVKKPKIILKCTYTGFKDSKPVAAAVQFRFGKTPDEAQRAFDDARLQFQTKPLLISGAESFWSSKTGELNLRKGRTWITLSVGSPKVNERDMADARKLAEILVKKM